MQAKCKDTSYPWAVPSALIVRVAFLHGCTARRPRHHQVTARQSYILRLSELAKAFCWLAIFRECICSRNRCLCRTI